MQWSGWHLGTNTISLITSTEVRSDVDLTDVEQNFISNHMTEAHNSVAQEYTRQHSTSKDSL